MITDAAREIWWPTFGLLALESALVIGVAAACGRLVQSAIWRRTIWQGCAVALLALVGIELCGGVRAWFSPRPLPSPSSTSVSAFPGGPATDETREPKLSASSPRAPVTSSHEDFGDKTPRAEPATAAPVSRGSAQPRDSIRPVTSANAGLRSTSIERVSSPTFFGWAILLWCMGTLFLLAKSFLSRVILALLQLRSTPIRDGQRLERLAALRADLKLRRRVRLFESERLSSPVACGVFWPAIGLPRGFGRNEKTARQEVMLMHELAHIQAGDPLWYWLGDVAVALWWWQPLAWWMRRHLHAASECVADEASLLVADGPGTLAECLVELGQRLTSARPTGWLGVEGGDFRSGLGRRVERLLGLGQRSWEPPKFLGSALARTLAPIGLIAVVGLATAWTIPVTSNKGDSMKNPLWNKPTTAVALAWAVGLQAISGAPAETNSPAGPPVVAPEITAGTGGGGRGGGGGGPDSQQARQSAKAAERNGGGAEARTTSKLKAKLESIVLDEVSYDCLPLNQVVEQLIKEAAKRDPEKTGVNFLMGKATELLVDPATGLPAKAQEPIELGSVTVCINPMLRKVRLIDVLDAITRVADRPVKYSIEEYAVVWTPCYERPAVAQPEPPAPPPVPQVRAFKLETNVFLKSLEKAFNINARSTSAEIRDILCGHVFPRVGLQLDSNTSSIIYNDVTGVLLVRATPQDLEIIQATVETLGGKISAPETASTKR